MIALYIYIGIVVIVGAIFSLIYFNLDRIVNMIDHSLERDRWWIKPVYENPIYLKKSLSKQWPGWDGWYALFIPVWKKEETNRPFNIVRISIMTGLYGVNGIDNYNGLRTEPLTRTKAGEYLGMVQTPTQSFLSQKYINKDTEMTLSNNVLDVMVKDQSLIIGKWPNYQVTASKDDIKVRIKLNFHAINVAWWANVKGIFSYWSAFSLVKGYIQHNNKRYDVKGFGSFEHGWNRFFIQINWVAQLLRIFSKIHRTRLIYYHYEILCIQEKFGAGTMLAGGPFGMNIRKRCETFFPNNKNHIFTNTKITYKEFENILNPVSNKKFRVPKKWEVSCSNKNSEMKYIAEASSPPAFIAGNMIYFDFACSGYFKEKEENGIPFNAKGYGEYVFM